MRDLVYCLPRRFPKFVSPKTPSKPQQKKVRHTQVLGQHQNPVSPYHDIYDAFVTIIIAVSFRRRKVVPLRFGLSLIQPTPPTNPSREQAQRSASPTSHHCHCHYFHRQKPTPEPPPNCATPTKRSHRRIHTRRQLVAQSSLDAGRLDPEIGCRADQ
jgi:hypothetical protein